VKTSSGDALQQLLTEQCGHKIIMQSNPVGEKRAWLSMATENAQLALKQMMNRQASQEKRLLALQQVLQMPGIQRIECFDISHTLGEATVASCVVYDNCAMRNNEYRRYNIENITPGDDYAAMREALTRRYQKIVSGEGQLPDLILIDGGKGQVTAALEALHELGISDANLVGVAKGEERKPGLEQLISPAFEKPLQLPH
jgi:excinuclease ABC subunit C